jgi:hypothetical protein
MIVFNIRRTSGQNPLLSKIDLSPQRHRVEYFFVRREVPTNKKDSCLYDVSIPLSLEAFTGHMALFPDGVYDPIAPPRVGLDHKKIPSVISVALW